MLSDVMTSADGTGRSVQSSLISADPVATAYVAVTADNTGDISVPAAGLSYYLVVFLPL